MRRAKSRPVGSINKTPDELVYEKLEDAVIADCPDQYIIYAVDLLGTRRYALASSSANAVRVTAYSLGATAKAIPVRDAVKAALASVDSQQQKSEAAIHK